MMIRLHKGERESGGGRRWEGEREERETEKEVEGRGERVERESGGRAGERGEREVEGRREWFLLIYPMYLHIPLYTFIYLHIPSFTSKHLKYLYIPSYTSIYIKISNIRKMRPDIKHKNGHKARPRASQGPEFDQKLPTMSQQALAHPKGWQII